MAENGAAEATAPTAPSTQDLQELTPATASIGEWVVKVYKESAVTSYSYVWKGQTRETKKVEVILIGQKAEEYCIGRAKRSPAAKDDNVIASLAAKFKSSTLWKMSKVCLMAEPKQHLGCPVKVVVDLAKTTFTPMLQNAVPMPLAPAPVEMLSGILDVKTTQRCDLTCLVQSIKGEPKHANTVHGERLVLEVSICDGSKAEGIAAKLSLALWFPSSAAGKQQIALFTDTFQKKEPLSLFGLYIQPEPQLATTKVSCKTSKDFWWMPCPEAQDTEKVQALRSQATDILALDLTELAAVEDWTPQEAVDYAACTATRVNVQLLQTIVQREKEALPIADAGGFVIFQINCVRIVEPSTSEEPTTKDGTRLFVPVRVMDDWGQMTLRMRESAALQASGLPSKDSFLSALKEGGLRFPILASIRVRVKRGSASTNASSQDEALIDAIIVEAEQQAMDEHCRPNSALMQVAEASRPLGGSNACMLVGKLSEVKRASHAGLCVNGTCCEFALVLCAINARSDMQKIGQGYRIVTSGLHEVTTSTGKDQPQLIEKPVNGTFVSMCTPENCVQYNLTPSHPKNPSYYVVVISNVIGTEGNLTYIVDRVSSALQADDRLPHAMLLDEMAKFAKLAKPDEKAKRSASWAEETANALTSAKKTRALSREPTNTPLPDKQAS